MAETKTAMRKLVFTKVGQLRPGTSGHNLNVKVVSSNIVLQKARPESHQVRQVCISECLVGDETGTILFTVDLMKTNSTVILRNTRIDIFKGSKRLSVGKWGRVEVTEPATFTVKEDNNLSLDEYELINVVRELPVELAGGESLMPLHSATASSLLKSMLSSKVGQWGSLSEGFATPL